MPRVTFGLAVATSILLATHAAPAQDLSSPAGCRFIRIDSSFDTDKVAFGKTIASYYDFLPDGRIFYSAPSVGPKSTQLIGTWTMNGDQLMMTSPLNLVFFNGKMSKHMKVTGSRDSYHYISVWTYAGLIP